MKVIVLFLCLLISAPIWAQNPLKLKDAIKIASLSNPTLKVESYDLPISNTELAKAKLHYNPIFNLQYLQLMPSSRYYEVGKSWLHPYNSQDWFQFTKKFQVFGQRKSKIGLAKVQQEVANHTYGETKRIVLNEVAQKWLEAWHALSYLQLTASAADYLDIYFKESFDSTKGQLRMEVDRKLRYDILDDQYDLEKSKAELEYFTVREELKLLLGTTDSISIDRSDTAEYLPSYFHLDTLLQLSKNKREDIQGLQSIVDLSQKNEQYQKRLAIPQPEAGFIWNPQNTIPYFGIFYTQPLPFFDRNQTEVAKARLIKESSIIDLEYNISKMRTEVTISLNDYLRKKEMVQRFKHNLRDAEKLLKMVRTASIQGKETVVDLWEAEETRFNTYKLYLEAVTDARKSYLKLLHQTNLLEQLYGN